MIRFVRFEKFGILLCIIYPHGMTQHYPVPLQIFCHKGDRVIKCNEISNVQFIHCCLDRESQQIQTYIQAYMQAWVS